MTVILGALLLLAIAVLAVATVTFIGVRASRDAHRSSGSLGNAMLEMQSVIEPAKKKVIEAHQREAEAEEEDESGDPPVK